MKGTTSQMTGALLVALVTTTQALDLYVSPNGSDDASGLVGKPVASFAAAQQKARKHVGKEAVTVHFDDGIYYLPETLVFTPEDSGSKAHSITYKAHNEGGAVLSGGSELELSWTPYKSGIFQAETPAGLVIDQLFIDGKNQRMARYPNYDPEKKAQPYQGFSADAFSKKRAAKWADPTGGYIHALHSHKWGGYHYRITGKDEQGEVTYEGGWQNNRQMGMHKDYRMVENIFEELDAEGEWFHNAKTNTLYFKLPAGTDLEKAKVEVVRLRHLIELQGTVENPVKHLSFQGFVVRHAARTFMDCKEPLLRSDWAIYRGGAFKLTGSEDISILDCEFDQVGGNAIFVNNYSRRTVVKGCHIHDAGASGVCFVGDPNAVHNPLFEYGERNKLEDIDRTLGPKTENYPSLGLVEDCLIHGIGTVERQPAGVQISMAAEITVRDTSIYDTARAGINVSEGTWGGHLIERVDVFDTVLETSDHGSFNSWGRDRYWKSASQEDLDKDRSLPFLDAIKTTVIRDSRWRCDHGWDIDLDDGSSNYDIYNNLMLNGGLKLREGFRRRAWNNITVNNSLSPHVWYENSDDEVYANIWMGPYRGVRVPTETAQGKRVDGNLFFRAEPRRIHGWDQNSILADPLFVDPASGDYRVKEGSPAFKLGFENFSMDQFGVKKPSLKAIARTPVLPTVRTTVSMPRDKAKKVQQSPPSLWMGAELRSLKGQEFSAYGVSAEDGGVALVKVPATSQAAEAGLKANDVIQGVNGLKVSNVKALEEALSSFKGKVLQLEIVRSQKAMALSVARTFIVEMDAAASAAGLKKLPLHPASGLKVTTNVKTGNDPLMTLTDGKLASGFGPVFGNGVTNGAYKMDLGAVKPVASVTSWSANVSGVRGTQKLTVYGSNSATDPGWDFSKFKQLGVIDTTGSAKATFTAASLSGVDGQSLGDYRWIVWAVRPVTENGGGENTSFQEMAVSIVGEETAKVSEGPAHLFLLAGQSNMVRVDPSVSFTPAVSKALGADSVIVAKDAENSQPISRWSRGWKSVQGQAAKQDGDLYDRMMGKVKEAVGDRELETVTLLWMQGENDASRNQVGAYKAALDQLLKQLREDFKREDIRFVIGRLSDYTLDTGKHPEWPAMRELQVAYADASPLGAWVDTDDLNNLTDKKTGKPRDDVHYSQEGYRIFGERLAEKAIGLIAPQSFPGEKSDFRGYVRYDRIKTKSGHFSVVCPKNPAPGKPWLWRSLFWEAIKKVSNADLKLVDEGYHVVLAHGDVAGHPKGSANIDAAYELLTTEYGFAKTCSMSSMSRGTLSLFRWASENPEKVNSIYVDNGVLNVLSWPAGKVVPGNKSIANGAPASWEDFKKKFGYATDEEALKTKESPIDMLEPLAKAGVPILLVCGNKDPAVPYEENDVVLEKRYKALGGDVTVIVEDKGHSHGMNDPTPVLEFIRKHSGQ